MSSYWEAKYDNSSQTWYYYNTYTGAYEWTMPNGYVRQPVDFEERTDPSSGRSYWYDKLLQTTTWEQPECLGEPTAKDFEERTDPSSGRSYWYNKLTKTTSWEQVRG